MEDGHISPANKSDATNWAEQFPNNVYIQLFRREVDELFIEHKGINFHKHVKGHYLYVNGFILMVLLMSSGDSMFNKSI